METLRLMSTKDVIELGSHLGHMQNIALLRALGCEQQAREASDSAIRKEWEALAIEWHQVGECSCKGDQEGSSNENRVRPLSWRPRHLPQRTLHPSCWVTDHETVFDIGLQIGYKQQISLISRDAFPEGMPEGWSGSGPRGRNCQSAPGRLRASSRPALRPVREVLAALAPGRVLPFAPGNSRKRGPELSRGVRALAKCRSGAPEGERAPTFGALPRPCTFRRRRLAVWRGHWLDAPLGAPLPSLLRMILRGEGSESKGLCCCGGLQTSGASASRERIRFSSFPTQVGEGDHTKCGGGGV